MRGNPETGRRTGGEGGAAVQTGRDGQGTGNQAGSADARATGVSRAEDSGMGEISRTANVGRAGDS